MIDARAFKRVTLTALCTAGLLSLAACGGGDDGNSNQDGQGGGGTPPPSTAKTTISGIAAKTSCFAGQIEVVNAAGTKSDPVATSCSNGTGTGAFSVQIDDQPPFLIRAVSGDETLFSFAALGGGSVNVTPLTTLAVLDANGYKSLADLFGNFAANQSGSARLNSDAALEGARKVVANLQAQFASAGLSGPDSNVFSGALSAGSNAGFTRVLAAVLPIIQCSGNVCTVRVNAPDGSELLSWNPAVSTTGVSFSAATGGGSGSGGSTGHTVTPGACGAPAANTVSIEITTTPGATMCLSGLAAGSKPTSESQFCADEVVASQIGAGGGSYTVNSCSFSGDTGTIAATISASGFSLPYTVNYRYFGS